MLYYRKKDNGKKDWVVFIHPLGGSSVTYYKQLKTFQEKFNLLLIDLHGHGKSNKGISGMEVNDIAKDIIDIINHENIQSAYFVGMCLGNVVVDLIYENYPHRIKSIVYGAAVKDITFFNSMLLKLGNMFKHFIPHSALYNLFALIMMPNKNHEESRKLFVKEAKKMKRNDFLDWYNLIISNQNFYFWKTVSQFNALHAKHIHLFHPPNRFSRVVLIHIFIRTRIENVLRWIAFRPSIIGIGIEIARLDTARHQVACAQHVPSILISLEKERKVPAFPL